jgi:predicted membrane protein
MYKYGMNDITKTMEDKKEKITEELSRQYSLNKISLEEYERLIEYAHKIETGKELMILEKIVSENNVTTVYKNTEKERINKAGIRSEYTILSSRKISGSILNEINGKIISILGDNHIIINDDDLIEDETFIDVVVVLGEIVIHIPEGITVINKAVPILGGIFGNEENKKRNQGKRLTITGKIILGNMTIKQNE